MLTLKPILEEETKKVFSQSFMIFSGACAVATLYTALYPSASVAGKALLSALIHKFPEIVYFNFFGLWSLFFLTFYIGIKKDIPIQPKALFILCDLPAKVVFNGGIIVSASMFGIGIGGLLPWVHSASTKSFIMLSMCVLFLTSSFLYLLKSIYYHSAQGDRTFKILSLSYSIAAAMIIFIEYHPLFMQRLI